MPIQFISPKKAVNSAFLKLPVSVENMERFRLSLANLYKKRDAARDEEYHKGEIWGFLKGIFNPDYSVQVKRPIDLAIFNGNDTSAKPAVIIEVKSPTNTTEMFSEQHPNTKALQELVYYFMQEYIYSRNYPEPPLKPKAFGKVEGFSDVNGEANQKSIADLEKQVNILVYQFYCITDCDEIDAAEKS